MAKSLGEFESLCCWKYRPLHFLFILFLLFSILFFLLVLVQVFGNFLGREKGWSWDIFITKDRRSWVWTELRSNSICFGIRISVKLRYVEPSKEGRNARSYESCWTLCYVRWNVVKPNTQDFSCVAAWRQQHCSVKHYSRPRLLRLGDYDNSGQLW